MGLEHKFFITSASRHIACGPKADNISQQSQPIIVFWGHQKAPIDSFSRLFHIVYNGGRLYRGPGVIQFTIQKFWIVIVSKRSRRFHVHLGVEQLETASKCPLLSPIGRLRHVMQRNTFPGHKFLATQGNVASTFHHSNFANHCT